MTNFSIGQGISDASLGHSYSNVSTTSTLSLHLAREEFRQNMNEQSLLEKKCTFNKLKADHL
jgi:hypothetical protein